MPVVDAIKGLDEQMRALPRVGKVPGEQDARVAQITLGAGMEPVEVHRGRDDMAGKAVLIADVVRAVLAENANGSCSPQRKMEHAAVQPALPGGGDRHHMENV